MIFDVLFWGIIGAAVLFVGFVWWVVRDTHWDTSPTRPITPTPARPTDATQFPPLSAQVTKDTRCHACFAVREPSALLVCDVCGDAVFDSFHDCPAFVSVCVSRQWVDWQKAIVRHEKENPRQCG